MEKVFFLGCFHGFFPLFTGRLQFVADFIDSLLAILRLGSKLSSAGFLAKEVLFSLTVIKVVQAIIVIFHDLATFAHVRHVFQLVDFLEFDDFSFVIFGTVQQGL
jgi:hypothetical protein